MVKPVLTRKAQKLTGGWEVWEKEEKGPRVGMRVQHLGSFWDFLPGMAWCFF